MSAGATRAGVIGDPIGHSLSPAIHRAWIAALGLDAAYDAIEVAPAELEAFVRRHRGGGTLAGVNVTLPHKEQALALADAADDAARRAGAANLLLFAPNGRVEARNTDGQGLLEALRIAAPDFDPKTSRIEILGAGGAARGAVAALAKAGATHITITNRTQEKAQTLADAFPTSARTRPWADVVSAGAEVVINATSLGLGDTPSPRLTWPAPSGPGVALDMVYRASRTGFLADAAEMGWTPVDGLEMLIGQAAPSFEALFGVAPPANYRALALAAAGART
jgi:shikimate dehydrogenase